MAAVDELGGIAQDGDRPLVLIYRSSLVLPGEPFIAEQPLAFERYQPQWVGVRRIESGPAAAISGQSLLVSDFRPGGRMAGLSFSAAGWAPTLARRLRARRPVLLHAHFGPEGVRCMRLARGLGVPLVTTYHGFDVLRDDDELRRGRWGDRWYLRRRARLAAEGSLHIAVSSFLREKLLDRGFPPERTLTHYIGVDTEVFARSSRPRDGVNVLFVGRLSPQKGCLDAIRAVAAVHDRFPSARMTIVGEGELRREAQDLSERLRVRCDFLGPQTREQVAALMQRATVLIGPSRTDRGAQEAFGLVFLEAQSTGLPVLANDTGGLAEAIANDQTGLLAREGDIKSLAASLERLLSDGSLREQMGAAGAARASRDFDLKAQSRRLEALYDEVAVRPSPRDRTR